MKKTSISLSHWIIMPALIISNYTQAATIKAIKSGNWENTTTWQSGILPSNGDSIVIPNGKTVEVTSVIDYSSGTSINMNIFGELAFQTGKKLTLPTGSLIYLQAAAYIMPGNGGGNSNQINVGLELVWNAGMGPFTGYIILPSTPLPVKLIDFKATATGNKIIALLWETATEVNNDYFDLERSRDAVHYITLGRVKGHGTSSVGYKYSFTDTYPETGANYYRLKQVDYDNKFAYSNIIYCKYKSSLSELIQLYPNPSMGEVFLIIPDEENNAMADVKIADSKANIILQKQFQPIPGSKGIQITDQDITLKPGIYFVTVTINDEQLRKQLIIY